MPDLYPPEPPAADRDGGAERTVWEHLRDQLPDDAVLMHGLSMVERGVEREIDCLVLWPGVGIAAVEVKGGRVTRERGRWLQGSGERRHVIDPFGQVQDARHMLTRLLAQRGLGAASARTAHLVVVPHTDVSAEWECPEAPSGMLLGRSDLPRVAEAVRGAIEVHGAGHAPLDVGALAQLVDYLAGSFPSQVEALALAAQHEDAIEQMTRDQAKLLDALRNLNRMRVVGGAGSGKTWMALEVARRRARAGERVALVCYSRGLGRYLERMTGEWKPVERPAYVGLFHDLPLSWGAEAGSDDDSDYYERRLPLQLGELAVARPSEELFDTVVVDEAQDFSDLWWPSLLRCLRDPDAGGLIAFSDEDQHVFDRDGSAPITLAAIALEENLRSTRQIAQTFGSFGDGMVKPRGMAGPPVRLVDVSFDEAISAGDDAVEALLADGWAPGQVALLATGRRHPLQVEAVGYHGYAEYWDEFFAGQDVFYGHVLGFKGLERTAVVLAVNGFHDLERARKIVYTGMSRARALLVVVGPRVELEAIGGEGVKRRLADADAWRPA
ncbi:NERD domain-containing protein [Isoptericola sp. b441]|uniref:NERD domain-containing protein n=1 Tax=Actinotalea lenta TaxID=3064654 RepID=A0ABT9DDA3_9CELL|nr:NERD domain-containing protein [Isoptericola sp. b441]MDO8108339.1 NERD domain-containing protein [Isoptericola sp. b441]